MISWTSLSLISFALDSSGGVKDGMHYRNPEVLYWTHEYVPLGKWIIVFICMTSLLWWSWWVWYLLFTSNYSLAWSTMSRSVSMLHLILLVIHSMVCPLNQLLIFVGDAAYILNLYFIPRQDTLICLKPYRWIHISRSVKVTPLDYYFRKFIIYKRQEDMHCLIYWNA